MTPAAIRFAFIEDECVKPDAIRFLNPVVLISILALLLCSACGQKSDRPQVGSEKNDSLPYLHVNGLYNSGFEWIADSTTSPPKYGAYWLGAFSPEENNGSHCVVEDESYAGKRCLRLRPDGDVVLQKVVADPRWTDQCTLILAVRLEGNAALELSLEDGPGRKATAVISGTPPEARWRNHPAPATGIRIMELPGQGARPWSRIMLRVGEAFARIHGSSPVPRMNVCLACTGPEGAHADLDEIYADLCWPRVAGDELERGICELVITTLDRWFLPPEEGGLGLIDPDTGYVNAVRFNIETGEDPAPNPKGGLHTVYSLLTLWLEYVHDRKWTEEQERWIPMMERFLRTLLAHNFDPDTALPQIVLRETLAPLPRNPVTVGAYVDFLIEGRKVIRDESLKAACLAQARRTADQLIRLQQDHDLPRDQVRNQVKWNKETNRFEGEWPNWFGHIPKNLNAQGKIEPPRRYNTSWAMVTGKPFWYHYFKSAAAIMAVHELAPRPEDLTALRKVYDLYDRPWDATRYDLENDTDDHYGYLTEDLLSILERSDGTFTPLLELVQKATDHRLEREAKAVDDTLWIQAIRLGSSCAGDSPRAFQGLLDLYELPADINPISAGSPLYREALLELARNDLKGRQLTNSQFTESFFKNWEMVCICFRGKYQGDCRDHPADYWHGDVGDIFGGPPQSSINAQAVAYRAATRGDRTLILSGLGIIRHVSDTALKRDFGYVYGLDPAIARQYELLDKYVIGMNFSNAAETAYAMAWLRLLPYLDTTPSPMGPRAYLAGHDPASTAAGSASAGGEVRIQLQGPPEGQVALLRYEGKDLPFPAPLNHRDGRMAAFAPQPGWRSAPCELNKEGSAFTTLALEGEACIVVQPVLLDPFGEAPLALGEALVIRSPEE